EIEEIYATLNENTDMIKSLSEQISQKQQEAIKLATEQEGKKDMAKQMRAQQSSVKEKIGQIENRIKNIRERIDEYNEDIDSQNAELHEKEKRLEDIRQNLEKFTSSIELSSGQINENQKQMGTNAGKIHNMETERSELQKQLASITEDIVTELDSKLKEAGYSAGKNKKAKEEINTQLEKIKIFTGGRTNIFKDYSNLSTHSEKDAAKFSVDAVQAFTQLGSMLEELSASIDTYIKTSPQFIDDFLSPEGIITKKRSIDDAITENIRQAENISKENEALSKQNDELHKKINEYKETLNKLMINRAEMIQQMTSCQQQISTLRKTLASEQATLKEQEDELFQENKRHEEIDGQIEEIDEQIAELQSKGDKLLDELNTLNKKVDECNSKVSGKESALKKKQDEKNRCQEQLENYNLNIAKNETEIRNVKQNFKDNYSRDLMEFEERMYTLSEAPETLRAKLSETKQKIQELGQVNFMAVEQFAEEKERYERQQESFADTKKSLDNLVRVNEEIRSKSAELFLNTYNKIRRNFHNMFRRMFADSEGHGGGRADLRLVDPANVLTTGVEIYAQPPGKKLQSISLLSGGEKTMTAMALLFATYQVHASPFCLLDEIDAALDNKNVISLVNVLRSFANVSQYIVITHNTKTAMGAYTMIGVTMEESGVTKVVQMRKDEDTLNGNIPYEAEDNFEEEDVEPEEGVILPPRPPRREHNPDGTLKVVQPEPQPQVQEAASESVQEADADSRAEKEEAIENEAEDSVEEIEGGESPVEENTENSASNGDSDIDAKPDSVENIE
ncbi:MAG: chromosome segregation protein SMC, partial [Treponema sp.]|nr:chromosome segregation protein SMC [Treponema sp.]